MRKTMSTNGSVIKGSVINGTAAEPAPGSQPLEPEAIAEQIRALRSHVPEYVHLPTASVRALRGAASVNPDFVQAAINAAGAASGIPTLLGQTPPELRQQTEEAARWTVVEDEARALLQGIATGNVVRRHRIGLTALQTYGVVRQLARKPEFQFLLPHLQEMKRKNKFGGKKAAAPATPQPPTQPSTPSSTTPSQPAPAVDLPKKSS
jgi:hypothetical protein